VQQGVRKEDVERNMSGNQVESHVPVPEETKERNTIGIGIKLKWDQKQAMPDASTGCSGCHIGPCQEASVQHSKGKA
jgi:hypothetical protein